MAICWLDDEGPGAGSGRDFELPALTGSGQITRKITGALWLPEKYDAKTPLVLLGHGASGDRYQAPIPALAKRFVSEAGFAAMAIDGPVHGLRRVGDGGRAAFSQEMQRPDCIDNMVAEWQTAVTTICVEKGIDEGRVGYYGLSMGTLFGLPLLASSMEICCAVIGLAGTTGAAKHWAEELRRSADRYNYPLLFLLQLGDELFPREGSLALFDALKSPDKRLHAHPGLHGETPAEEIDHAFDFLVSHLNGMAERKQMAMVGA